MKKITSIFIFTLVSFSAPLVQAGIFADVYAGYTLASFNKDSYTGTTKGVKLGARSFLVGLGLDYSQLDLSYKNENIMGKGYGVTLDVDPSLLPFRFWGTYMVKMNWDYKNKAASNATDKSSGFKLGVGFGIFPFVDMFLESQTYSPNLGKKDDKIQAYAIGLSIGF